MTSYELAKTFFPSCRKLLIPKQISLLQTRGTETRKGETRIKINFAMPLDDGKQVGMPSWVGDEYDTMAREGSMLTYKKWGHEITEMTTTFYTADDSPKPSLVAPCPLFQAFTMQRSGAKDDDLPGINLHFEVYMNDSTEAWSWFRRNYRQATYGLFQTTQMELPVTSSAPDTQMKLGDDNYEAARKDATSKAHDRELSRAQ